MSERINPDLLIDAYMSGYFPMAESRNGEIYWHCPEYRAIIPFENIKEPRSSRQTSKKEGFYFTRNKAFRQVIENCAVIKREHDSDTWISEEIIENYTHLHKMKYAHSVETWKEDNLVGGLYGVAIGGAFFGESMFSLVSGASKAAFYRLAEHLRSRGYSLIDSQYLNPHTRLLGAVEVPKFIYFELLRLSLSLPCKFE